MKSGLGRPAMTNEIPSDQEPDGVALAIEGKQYEPPLEVDEIYNGGAELLPSALQSDSFPLFANDVNQSYPLDEGTTLDKAEFITHNSTTQDYDPERDRLEQMAKTQKAASTQRPPESDRSMAENNNGPQKQPFEKNRMRGENVSDAFKFVSMSN